MKEVQDTRYVVRTTMGKPLFVAVEQRAINSKSGSTVSAYHLTEELLEAAKCINLTTAKTLIKDYEQATGSTKTFAPIKVAVTYRIEEDSNG